MTSLRYDHVMRRRLPLPFFCAAFTVVLVLKPRAAWAEPRPSAELHRAGAPHRPTAVLVPDEPSGPALTVAGSTVMLAGWGVITAAVAIEDCTGADSDACTRRKFGLMYGGVIGAGVGGALLGIGLQRWRGALARQPPDGAPSRRALPGVRAAGIALTVIGAVSTVAGFVIGLQPVCALGCKFGVASPLGPVMFAAGAAPFSAGLPLLILGSHELPDGRVPTLRPHGLGLAADWQF